MTPQSPQYWYLIDVGDIVWYGDRRGEVVELSIGHETTTRGKPWGGTKPNGEGYMLIDLGNHGRKVVKSLSEIRMDPEPFDDRGRRYLAEVARENREARRDTHTMMDQGRGNMDTQIKPEKKKAAKPAKLEKKAAKPTAKTVAAKPTKEKGVRPEPPEGYPYTIAEAGRLIPLSKLSMRKYVVRLLAGELGIDVPHVVHQGLPRFSDESVKAMRTIKEANEKKWGPKNGREAAA